MEQERTDSELKGPFDDSNSIKVVGFLDDDITKIGRTIEGLRVQSLNNKLQNINNKGIELTR